MSRNKYPELTVNRILETAMQLFLKKGYEQTTIQDIIEALGDLSKGAIYHHFKSKPEIFDAVMNRNAQETIDRYIQIRDSKNLCGLEKIKQFYFHSLDNMANNLSYLMVPNFIKHPKLLAAQIESSIYVIAPEFIEVVVREGILDGSIQTEFPKELSEVLLLISNIWLNPVVFTMTQEEMANKCLFFKHMTEALGVPLVDDELLKKIEKLFSFPKLQ